MQNNIGYLAHGVGPLAPPEGYYVTAGCGCEVSEGEYLYECENGQTLCSECLADKFDELSLDEKATLFGCGRTQVERARRFAS